MEILNKNRGVYVGKGSYVGPIAHLKGKTALLRTSLGKLLAQFDDTGATLSGRAASPKEEAGGCDFPDPDLLGYGWHEFPESDFEEVIQEG